MNRKQYEVALSAIAIAMPWESSLRIKALLARVRKRVPLN